MKLIASDFDGTIGRGEQLIADRAAVLKFREKGNLFLLVSGRNSKALKTVREQADLPCDYLLSDSGGTCYQKSGEGSYESLLFSKELPKELLLPLCDFLLEKGTKLLSVNRFDGCDLYYYVDKEGKEVYPLEKAKWVARPFTQLSGYFESEALCLEVTEELNRTFREVTAFSNGDCMDITGRGYSKAVGLRTLAEKIGVKEEDIYTVGDHYNDLSMLDAFHSFVVQNAPEEVQKHASEGVVSSVSEMIERLLT